MTHDLLLAAAGFLVGLAAGWLARTLYQTRTLAKEVADKMDDLTHRLDHDDRGALDLDRARDVVVVVMLAIVIYTGIQSSLASSKISDTQHDLKREVACQAAWNDSYADVQAQRAQWSTEDRNALTAMVHALRYAKTDEEAADGLSHYLDVVTGNDKKRQAHPLPENNCDRP